MAIQYSCDVCKELLDARDDNHLYSKAVEWSVKGTCDSDYKVRRLVCSPCYRKHGSLVLLLKKDLEPATPTMPSIWEIGDMRGACSLAKAIAGRIERSPGQIDWYNIAKHLSAVMRYQLFGEAIPRRQDAKLALQCPLCLADTNPTYLDTPKLVCWCCGTIMFAPEENR